MKTLYVGANIQTYDSPEIYNEIQDIYDTLMTMCASVYFQFNKEKTTVSTLDCFDFKWLTNQHFLSVLSHANDAQQRPLMRENPPPTLFGFPLEVDHVLLGDCNLIFCATRKTGEDKMTEYTIIKNPRIRTKICDLMSEMLDNPDEHGIYPTSRFMSKMEDFIIAEKRLSYAHN